MLWLAALPPRYVLLADGTLVLVRSDYATSAVARARADELGRWLSSIDTLRLDIAEATGPIMDTTCGAAMDGGGTAQKAACHPAKISPSVYR